MDKLFGMYFVEALASAKREVKREENRKRRRRMSAETNAKKAVVCSVCRMLWRNADEPARRRIYLQGMPKKGERE